MIRMTTHSGRKFQSKLLAGGGKQSVGEFAADLGDKKLSPSEAADEAPSTRFQVLTGTRVYLRVCRISSAHLDSSWIRFRNCA